MIKKVSAAISKYGMLSDGERVTVGLSGGADSVSLLIALNELGYDVRAVHINHNLRGEESLRDQNFCFELCKKLSVPFEAVSVDVKTHAGEKKLSLELSARELRYEALYKLANDSKIALAHTLSDCLETSIFNLIRGGGVHGLASIPPVRGTVIRPLIDCTRDEIEKFLLNRGEKYVTDSTNLLPKGSRNIIRLNVIPELKKINPGIYSSYLASVSALREADTYINQEAEELLESCGKDFSGVTDGAVLSRAIAVLLQSEGIEPSYEKISSAKKLIKTGGIINIKKGVYLCSDDGRLSFMHDVQPEDEYYFDFSSELILSCGKLVVTKLSPFDISHYQKKELRYIVDESKISGGYAVRHLKGAEKIRLPNRNMTQEIKKLLEPSLRRTAYIIADEHGAVFVEGLGVSERVCCTDTTVSALKIEVIRGKQK